MTPQSLSIADLKAVKNIIGIPFIARWVYKIPKYKNNVWWNQSCHMRDEKYPKVFDENKQYINCRIGQEVIMGVTVSGLNILYKVIKVWHSEGSDWLYDTDSYTCNLQFSRLFPPTTEPKNEEK